MVFFDVPKRMDEVQIKEEYISRLNDLVTSCKPLICGLTFLARENRKYAVHIVAAIEYHLDQVETEVKLYVLYLIDCILKHVGDEYILLFSQNIVSTFRKIFQTVVDKETKHKMYALRTTWNRVFQPMLLLDLDLEMNKCDAVWPISLGQSLCSDVSEECIATYRQLIRQQHELDALHETKRRLELEEERLKHLSISTLATSFHGVPSRSYSEQEIQISEMDSITCKDDEVKENFEHTADDDDVILIEAIPDVIVIDDDCDKIQIPGLDLV